MAIPGIYSHWVTNDILAMSRPNTDTISKHNIIHSFKEYVQLHELRHATLFFSLCLPLYCFVG